MMRSVRVASVIATTIPGAPCACSACGAYCAMRESASSIDGPPAARAGAFESAAAHAANASLKQSELRMLFQVLRVHADRPQAIDKIAPAVVEQHFLGLRKFDVAKQCRIVGVVGERKAAVHPVPERRAAVERPA